MLMLQIAGVTGHGVRPIADRYSVFRRSAVKARRDV
jgi:hypothetical protein